MKALKTAHNKAYPRRSEYLTWASPHCAKGRATSGKQDVMRNGRKLKTARPVPVFLNFSIDKHTIFDILDLL